MPNLLDYIDNANKLQICLSSLEVTKAIELGLFADSLLAPALQILEEFLHDYPDIPLYLEINEYSESVCLSHLPSTVHCVNTDDQCTHGCAYNYLVSTIKSNGMSSYKMLLLSSFI